MSDNRKGVGVRLYVAGGSEVRREFGDVANSGKRMWSEIASGQSTANPALRALSAGVGEVRQGISGLAEETGAAGRVLGGFGAMGVAAAAALGGAAIAFGQAVKAMQMGDEISDAAAKVGISTDALQEYRYAIAQAGGATQDADAAIAAFTRTLGAAESGLSPRAMKAFKALGFTAEDLKGFKDADAALQAVAAKIADLGSEAERAAVADKLGLTPMLPLLREGTAQMDSLREAAHTLGYVMDSEVVASMGDANDKFEAASLIIKTQFAEAFVQLVPILVEVMQSIANLARQTNDFFDGFRKIEDRQRQSLVDRRAALLSSMVELGVGAGSGSPAARATLAAKRAEYDAIGNELDYRNQASRASAPIPIGQLADLGGGGSGRKARAPKAGKGTQFAVSGSDLTAGLKTAFDPATGRKLNPISDEEWLFQQTHPKDEAAKIKIETSVDLKSALADATQGFDEMRQQTTDAFKSGLEFALHGGNIFDLFKQRLEEAAIDGLSKALMNSLGGQAGGGGIGGFIASAVTFLFGGGRHANNSTINGGEVSSYAEYGSELALFNKPGQIFNHADTVKLLQGVAGGGESSGGVSVMFAPVINAQGAGPREVDALKAELAKMKREIPGTIIATVNDGMNRRSIRRV